MCQITLTLVLNEYNKACPPFKPTYECCASSVITIYSQDIDPKHPHSSTTALLRHRLDFVYPPAHYHDV